MKPKIMLVDDKPRNLKALKKLLESPEFDIMAAVTGKDALAMALEHDFALAILDAQMTEMGGFETARLFNENSATKNIPIIFVTDSSQNQRKLIKAYEAGAVDFLFRPVNPEILKSKINVFLSLHRQKADLEKANRELIKANQAKGEFLDRMTHEIKTPISGILGMTNMMQNASVPAEMKGFVETIRTSATNLKTIVNGILDFSRIDSGEVEIEQNRFNLSKTMKEVEFVLAIRANEKKLDYECSISPEVPKSLSGDSTRLRQIILHMVGNAARHTKKGKITASVSLARRWEDKVLLRFNVSDTGMGIPPEKIDSVFKPFTQGVAEPGAGIGLGLAIVKKLAGLMGGETGVESQPGRGSDFWFTALFGCSEVHAENQEQALSEAPALALPLNEPPPAVMADGETAGESSVSNAPVYENKVYSSPKIKRPSPREEDLVNA